MTDTIESLRAERDQALAACAEMRAALESACAWAPGDYGPRIAALLARTDLGRGMVAVSRETLQLLRARILHLHDDPDIYPVLSDLDALLDGGKGRG